MSSIRYALSASASIKTLQQWYDWASTTLTVDGNTIDRDDTPSDAFINSVQIMRVSGTFASSGTMTGSPWDNRRLTTASIINRAVQHSVDSEAHWNDIIAQAAQGVVFIDWNHQGTIASANLPSLTRNGYTSDAAGSDADGGFIETVWYFNETARQAYKMSPNAGTGPVVFNNWG